MDGIFHNEFFRLIRLLDREQPGKGEIIQASGEALELDAALVLASIISPRIDRRSMRVRFFSIAGVSNEMCGMLQRCSAINQIGYPWSSNDDHQIVPGSVDCRREP